MAYVTSLTAARMLDIEASSVINGYVNGAGNLILMTHAGDEIDAGVVFGATGTGVMSVTPFFLQQSMASLPPPRPMVLEPTAESPWKLEEPPFASGTDLWVTTRVVYSDTTFQYSTPVRSSAYTAVGQAALDAAQANDAAAAAEIAANQAVSDASTAITDAGAAKARAEEAFDKANDVELGVVTANGRITIAEADPTFVDGEGKPVNALWEVRSGSTALRRYIWDGTAWGQIQLGQDFIGDGAIGTAQIADAAIGTAQIGDAQITNAKIGDVSIGKLTVTGGATFPTAVTDVLFAGQAFIDQLVAERAIITGQKNRIKNGLLDSGVLAPWDPTIFTRDTADKPSGLTASIRTAVGRGTVPTVTSPVEWIGLVPGAKYKFEIWAKASVPGSMFYLEFTDQTSVAGAHAIASSVYNPADGGESTGTGPYLMQARTLNTTWTKYTSTLTITDTATAARLGRAFFNHPSGGATNAAVSLAGISLKQIVTADVVVDGAVLIGSLAPEVMEAVNDNITTTTGNLQEALSTEISDTVNTAVSGIPDTYATKEELQTTEETTTVYADSVRDDVLSTVDNVITTVETLQSDVDGRNSLYDLYFYLSPEDGLVIGQQDSPFKVRLTDQALTFEQGGVVVAYISNKKLFITDAEVTNAFTLGKFDFVPRSNGNLSFKYRG